MYKTREDALNRIAREYDRKVARLATVTVLAVEDGVALLSDGNTALFIECPKCGCKFIDFNDRDWMRADTNCPECDEFIMGWTNPFDSYTSLALPVGVPWTGVMPEAGGRLGTSMASNDTH